MKCLSGRGGHNDWNLPLKLLSLPGHLNNLIQANQILPGHLNNLIQVNQILKPGWGWPNFLKDSKPNAYWDLWFEGDRGFIGVPTSVLYWKCQDWSSREGYSSQFVWVEFKRNTLWTLLFELWLFSSSLSPSFVWTYFSRRKSKPCAAGYCSTKNVCISNHWYLSSQPTISNRVSISYYQERRWKNLTFSLWKRF